jgi:hypothetical protein
MTSGRNFGKQVSFASNALSGAFGSALQKWAEKFILFGNQAAQTVSTTSKTLSEIDFLMREKRNRQHGPYGPSLTDFDKLLLPKSQQYGPPQRRTHMRHRHHR